MQKERGSRGRIETVRLAGEDLRFCFLKHRITLGLRESDPLVGGLKDLQDGIVSQLKVVRHQESMMSLLGRQDVGRVHERRIKVGVFRRVQQALSLLHSPSPFGDLDGVGGEVCWKRRVYVLYRYYHKVQKTCSQWISLGTQTFPTSRKKPVLSHEASRTRVRMEQLQKKVSIPKSSKIYIVVVMNRE